jgi:pyruvate,water dikinase
MSAVPQFVRWFFEIGINDVPLVGGKNASLGEMYRELDGSGVKVPNGFAVTAEGYRHFLRSAGLDRAIPDLIAGLDTTNVENLRLRGRRVRDAILVAQFPSDLEDEIVAAYE